MNPFNCGVVLNTSNSGDDFWEHDYEGKSIPICATNDISEEKKFENDGDIEFIKADNFDDVLRESLKNNLDFSEAKNGSTSSFTLTKEAYSIVTPLSRKRMISTAVAPQAKKFVRPNILRLTKRVAENPDLKLPTVLKSDLFRSHNASSSEITPKLNGYHNNISNDNQSQNSNSSNNSVLPETLPYLKNPQSPSSENSNANCQAYENIFQSDSSTENVVQEKTIYMSKTKVMSCLARNKSLKIVSSDVDALSQQKSRKSPKKPSQVLISNVVSNVLQSTFPIDYNTLSPAVPMPDKTVSSNNDTLSKQKTRKSPIKSSKSSVSNVESDVLQSIIPIDCNTSSRIVISPNEVVATESIESLKKSNLETTPIKSSNGVPDVFSESSENKTSSEDESSSAVVANRSREFRNRRKYNGRVNKSMKYEVELYKSDKHHFKLFKTFSNLSPYKIFDSPWQRSSSLDRNSFEGFESVDPLYYGHSLKNLVENKRGGNKKFKLRRIGLKDTKAYKPSKKRMSNDDNNPYKCRQTAKKNAAYRHKSPPPIYSQHQSPKKVEYRTDSEDKESDEGNLYIKPIPRHIRYKYRQSVDNESDEENKLQKKPIPRYRYRQSVVKEKSSGCESSTNLTPECPRLCEFY